MTMTHNYPLLLSLLILLLSMALLLALRWRLQRRTLARQRLGLKLLQLLSGLIVTLQRHRGLSTGVLRGDASLRSNLDQARASLDAALSQSAGFDLFLARNECWQGITDHWSRLRQPSPTTTPASNLLQHNHMISHLIFLTEDVAGSLNLTARHARLSYQPYIWREVIQAAEWAGQARALGTGIAAAGSSSAQERIRLRFLRDKIQHLSQSAFVMLRQKSVDQERFNLQSPEVAVQHLLTCIEQELLRAEQTEITAKAYFDQATIAIDALFTLVQTALIDLEQELSGSVLRRTSVQEA